MKNIYSIIGILFLTLTAQAQDPKPTIFDGQLMLLSPALTGEIEGDYIMQLGVQQRNQWFDAINDYYNYSAVTLESTLPICFRDFGRISFSPGLSYLQERFPIDRSQPRMFSQRLGLSTAARIQLAKGFYAAVGFEYELLQRSIKTTDALQFGSQYDGMGGFDSTLPSLETAINTANLRSGIKSDLATGIAIGFGAKHIGFRIGGAIHHLTRPVLSLLGNPNEDEARISHRYTAYYRLKADFGWDKYSNKVATGAGQLYGAFIAQGRGIWQVNQGAEVGVFSKGLHYVAFGAGVRLTNDQFSSENLWTDTYFSIRWSYESFTIVMASDFAHSPFSKLANDNTATAIEFNLNYRFAKGGSGKCGVHCPKFSGRFKRPIGNMYRY
ncbi:MAG: hypothetical protein AAF847_01340 [Bacteroidota bacterium]